MSVMQYLKETDINRTGFATWMLADVDTVGKIWFSGKSHFYLNGAVSKKNCRVWCKAKPDFYLEKPLHDIKITIWAALKLFGCNRSILLRIGW